MTIPNRIFQVSLRTIFEITFVVAVVLAFLYWRSQPRSAMKGRYELHINPEDRGGQVLFDSQTGRTWSRYRDGRWTEFGKPPAE
jgi:hypothetical protein